MTDPIAEIAPAFARLLKGILPRAADRLAVPDIPLPAAAPLAAGLGAGRILVILPDPRTADRFLSDAALLLRGRTLLPLSPADDDEALLTGERIAQLRAILACDGPALIAASVHALLQPIPDPDLLDSASLTFAKDAEAPFDTLAETLTERGYERCEQVTEPLFFALRGGILDIWPAGADTPVRIEFFGDTVEGIRTFDPGTQCSVGRLRGVTVPPAPKADLRTADLLPRLTGCAVLVWDWPAVNAAAAQLAAGASDDWLGTALRDFAPGPVCFVGDPQREGCAPVPLDVAPADAVTLPDDDTAQLADRQAAKRREILNALAVRASRKRPKETVILCAESAAAQELLAYELPRDCPVRITCAPLSQGFRCGNLALTVVAQSDLYPRRRTWRAPARRRSVAGQRFEYALDVEPGELVVHLSHGIGRFLGMTEITVDGVRSEVFAVEYADGAKLYVPTAHVHLLSRYIGPRHGGKIKLHTLGGKRWQKEKEAAGKGIEDLAVSLLETQARRRVLPGFAYRVDDPWIAQFEALFPYAETPDQIRVIAEIKADMAAPLAMDRLLCGDAGYGKTEIAMRAAFIAAVNHKQVAVLAPTTVLAEQHFETFCDRMRDFPVRIDVLSRFRTPAQREATRLAAARGEVDILIGTHALLSEDVPFADLGLLIIDEEQRFGVVHKERLRALRALIDILTMSATPIPRTLYLSLTGARDLSLLQTPPQDRVAVETVVQRDEDAVIAGAIRREMARGGQVFYLYNRVLTITRVRDRILRLLPKARVIVAHARMAPAELAAAMKAFERGEADVLVSTTIIGSGIDIPRANTILIDRADRFGLADLYQLRGRVGRSAVKGFAYLLLPPEGTLDSDARARLMALRRHSGLGAGYHIALRDLEIRGSGNLLGAAQSGHIAAIGFGLYCQLLRRTVARLKGEPLPSLVDTEIALTCFNASPGAAGADAAALPYDYIEDEAQRMNVHRRVAEAATAEELDALSKELRDRFGPLPPAAKRYLRIARLRIRAAEKRLAKVEIKEGLLTFYSKPNHSPVRGFSRLPLPTSHPDRILTWVEQQLERL